MVIKAVFTATGAVVWIAIGAFGLLLISAGAVEMCRRTIRKHLDLRRWKQDVRRAENVRDLFEKVS